MKLAHNVAVTVYCKPEDNEEEVVSNLRKLFPFELEKEKIQLSRKKATSFEERVISIFQVMLKKDSHINKFLEHLNKQLSTEQRELLIRQRESRLDPENLFFLRIDKEILIKEDRRFITEYGNCYHIRISIAAFPTTRENALAVVEKIFS